MLPAGTSCHCTCEDTPFPKDFTTPPPDGDIHRHCCSYVSSIALCFRKCKCLSSTCSTVKQKYSASFVKSKEFSQKCLTNKAKTAILKIFTAMGLLVYHEKGFDGKKRERILHCRESAAGVSRQQGVQDNWSPSRRRNRRALSRISRLCRILSVSRVHIVRCDEWTHTLRQKEWYHGEK